MLTCIQFAALAIQAIRGQQALIEARDDRIEDLKQLAVRAENDDYANGWRPSNRRSG